jgi:hypothetical protein
MGASSRIPDSTVYQESVTVTLQGTSVKVRTYDEAKKQMYRVQWYGRSPLGHPTIGSIAAPTVRQDRPHAAQLLELPPGAQRHQPDLAAGALPDRPQQPGRGRRSGLEDDRGLQAAPSLPGCHHHLPCWRLTGTTAIAKVPETTLVADQQFSTNFSKETTYADEVTTA